MNIAIFGASGATGKLLTQRCLDAGHQVTALVRTPSKFPFARRVRIVTGDATDPSAIADTIEGADAVLCALGAPSLAKSDLLERATPLIVDAMLAAHIDRIVVLGSAGALPSALDKQPAWRRWLVENIIYTMILKWPVASTRAEYAALARSPLDWTMAMPSMLTNGSAQGKIRIDGDALPRNATRISRADVADFMMQQLNSPRWSRQGVYLSW